MRFQSKEISSRLFYVSIITTSLAITWLFFTEGHALQYNTHVARHFSTTLYGDIESTSVVMYGSLCEDTMRRKTEL